MIGILTRNNEIFYNLQSKSEDVVDLYNIDKLKKLDGVFIDWVGEKNKEDFVIQALIVEKFVKTKIPFVIFDGSLSMTRKEFDWLKKFKTFFFEPAIQNRREFAYMPHWIDRKRMEHEDHDNDERYIHLAFKTENLNDKIKYFEMYYRSLKEMYPDMVVQYQTDSIYSEKQKQYTANGILKSDDIDFKQVYHTVLIDSQKNYEIGYIPPYIFEVMKYGCLPFLPLEHKWFGNMFKNLTVANASDVEFAINAYKRTSHWIVNDIIETIEKRYPEFLIENVTNKIMECLGR